MAAGEAQITEQHLSDDFLDDVRRLDDVPQCNQQPGAEAGAAPAPTPPLAEPSPIPSPTTSPEPIGAAGEQPDAGGRASVPGRTLGEAEIDLISRVLAEANGNISEASKRLGISRNTIYRKLRWGKPV